MKTKVVVIGNAFYGIVFGCPGCKSAKVGSTHMLHVHWTPPETQEHEEVRTKPHWKFNGDHVRPTFHPSILATYGCPPDCTEVHLEDDGEHWPYFVCHSFIENGRIQYLEDCTHSLRGQCVDLPDMTEV